MTDPNPSNSLEFAEAIVVHIKRNVELANQQLDINKQVAAMLIAHRQEIDKLAERVEVLEDLVSGRRCP